MPDIQTRLTEAVSAGRIAGAVAMAADGAGITHTATAGPMARDTIFHIASMTKAITGVAAMQLVEDGRLSLDQPAASLLPEQADPHVLEGFGADGAPILRPAKGHVTLRHLLTHTSGHGYDFCNADLARYHERTGLPSPRTGRVAALGAPLTFDPGTRWQYSIGIDIAGRMVEAASGETLDAYMRRRIFAPLGMDDTAFTLTDAQRARLAPTQIRGADGGLTAAPPIPPRAPEFFAGGGGLFSTAPDYLAFLRMLIGRGSLGGARVLKPETVSLMLEDHLAPLSVEKMVSAIPQASNDFELFPGTRKGWGLSFLINTAPNPGGRGAGSGCWGGIRNTYYWFDPAAQRAGVLMTQLQPFGDPAVLGLLDAFERDVYRAS